MSRTRKTPLAWSNMTHDVRRMTTSLAGIAFAVILMFTELGFLNALLDSTVALIGILDLDHNDLVLLHHDKETLADAYRFTRRQLYQVRACPRVERAEPIYLENNLSDWENPVTGESLRIRVVATEPRDRLLELPGRAEALARLSRIGTALFDLESKSSFGFAQLQDAAESGDDVKAVLGRRSIHLLDTFRLGTDFVNDGNLLMGLRTFAEFFPGRRTFDLDFPTVDLGVLKLAAGADPRRVRDELEANLPQDVRVLTKKELIAQEQGFWKQHTPIEPIFRLGMFLGFIVGVVICYQVLSSDIRDHLAEYATLKAMGYRDPYLIGLVFRQALWLALLGLLPGTLVSAGLYNRLSWWTGLPMSMTTGTVALVGGLTVAMCLISAYLASRQLFTMDPAELFR